MEKNQKNERASEQDQLRGNTMNETIRNVNGDRDMEQNETLKDAEQGSGRSYDYGTEGSDVQRGGTHYDQQNTSNSRGSTTDLDDDSISGAGRSSMDNTRSAGSGIKPKRSVTGSDLDGQHPTT